MFRDLEGFFESPEDAPPRRLAMLRGYFDESGHETKEWVCLAGFVGNKDQWNAMAAQWKPALGQRPTLHMSGLRWKQERTRRLLARLGPIPHACGLIGARGVVRVSDYSDLITDSDDERLYKGYMACLTIMVPKILEGTPPDERVEFVFEQQKEYERVVDMLMALYSRDPKYINSDGKPKVARWAFVPKGSTILTDPADYLAFALREMHAFPDSKKSRWCAPILQGRADGFGRTLPRDMVRRIVRRTLELNKEQGLS